MERNDRKHSCFWLSSKLNKQTATPPPFFSCYTVATALWQGIWTGVGHVPFIIQTAVKGMRRERAWGNTGKVRQWPRPRRRNLANEIAFLFSGHQAATLCSQVNSRRPCSTFDMCLDRPGCLCASHSSAAWKLCDLGQVTESLCASRVNCSAQTSCPIWVVETRQAVTCHGTALETTWLHTRSAWNSVGLLSAAAATAICTTLLNLTSLPQMS